MMANLSSIPFTTSVSSSAITFSQTGLFSSTITSYQVVCSNESLLLNDSELYSQSSSHTITILANSSTSSVSVRNLVPGLAYNCCISAVEDTPIYCKDTLMLGSGLSLPVVGVIGGSVGVVVAVLVLLAILGIVCILCKTYRSV